MFNTHVTPVNDCVYSPKKLCVQNKIKLSEEKPNLACLHCPVRSHYTERKHGGDGLISTWKKTLQLLVGLFLEREIDEKELSVDVLVMVSKSIVPLSVHCHFCYKWGNG